MEMEKIVQCVPNYSEGKDLEVVEKIVEAFKNKDGVKLLSYEPDKDYNRTVVTVIGRPEAVKNAVIESVGIAREEIDLREHVGEHSRMGATDVIPFIPIRGMSMEEAVEISEEAASEISEKYDIPTFLYENSAKKEERKNLANVRRGEFEGMGEKITKPEWKPDFGPAKVHPSAGATAVGARFPLIAYNIDLDTENVEIANKIARSIRHSSGGFRYIKAGGVEIKERGITQVTMNITNYQKTSIYRVFETVKMEAKRYGVNVLGSEIVGLTPMEALLDTAAYYLGLYGFDGHKVIETNLLD